ncbi:tyrosine-type recombinase/integrase [Paenibacillus vini]|uniref:tyrosine-type recombinase/integrase n=1 Tax=Paenibacillus vini TaxID=1476024 RepID=UPI001FD5EA55|nr:tyrosine-type recombinase/integrase [Paenibacillus vini]
MVFLLLKFAIKDFHDDVKYRNLSPKTISGYLMTLNEFQEYAFNNELVNVEDIRTGTIRSYLLYCREERGNNPTTTNSKLHTLKVFFNYLEREEVIQSAKLNPIRGIMFAKEDIQIQTFNENHIKQILNYYRRSKDKYSSFSAYRNYCMVIFFLGSGARLGEAVNLRWNDVDLVNGVLVLYGKKREQSSIPVTDKLIKELAEYKVFCEQHFKESSDYVFVTDENKKLAVDTVKTIFKRLKRDMNFKDVRCSPHTFRHTFAKNYLMNGGDALSLQKMLRHKQLAMTQRYVNLFGTELRKLNDQYNPLQHMDI